MVCQHENIKFIWEPGEGIVCECATCAKKWSNTDIRVALREPPSETSHPMDKETFRFLNYGDVVRPIGDARLFIVTGSYGRRVTAVATADLTNPDEWTLVLKARLSMNDGKMHDTE